MVTTPIPRYLLPHSCVLVKKSDVDKWGNCTAIETDLTNVRMCPIHSRRYSLSGDLPELSAKMFYDCVNSSPQDVSFATGDTIRFNGAEFIIQSVETFYTYSDTPHHLEVMLK